MDKPIYCFKVNPYNGEITKYTIIDYRKRKINDCGRVVYTFRNPKACDGYAHYAIENSKLDRFVNYKLFTFEDDRARTERIIANTLCEKYLKAKIEAQKLEKLMDMLNIEYAKEINNDK